MARDYDTRRYIFKQAESYNDKRLTDVLIRAFENIYNNKEPDGCLSTSVALHIILRSLGYDPKICYGLCITPAGNEIYHAWLELDKKVLDIAIYGNSHFSPYWHEGPLGPVIFEDYDFSGIKYGNHVFDEEWNACMISQGIRLGSVANYIAAAPRVSHPSQNGMWRLIFNIMDETYTSSKRQHLEKFVSKEVL